MATKPNIYQNAIFISDGACNPSGVAHTILETIQHLRDQGESTEHHPALALMVHQLAHITGALTLENSLNGAWSEARAKCRLRATTHTQEGNP